MSIMTYCADSLAVDYSQFHYFDHIITDPPYDMDKDVFESFIYRIIDAGKFKGNIIAFCKPENQWRNPDEYLFWMKPLSTKNYTKKCGRFMEIICVYRGIVGTFNCLHWSQMTGTYTDLIDYPIDIHPYKKPLSLMERLVRIYTNPGDTVFDPFMGSGTTGDACVRNDRHFIGIEKEKQYYEYATRRLDGS